jgi:hypothetical protein
MTPVHPELVAKVISAMSGATTLDEFCKHSGIASRTVARDLAQALLSRGIGSGSTSAMSFSPRDRLAAATLALESGCDPEQVSKHLSWKDFEQLAAEVLSSLGYSTKTNVRFTKPRMELDVVGTSAGLAIAVDCKHWERNNSTSIAQFCTKQAARAEELVKRNAEIREAVPAILTLHAERMQFVAGVPVVPVAQFKSFAMDVQGFLSEVRVIRRVPASR